MKGVLLIALRYCPPGFDDVYEVPIFQGDSFNLKVELHFQNTDIYCIHSLKYVYRCATKYLSYLSRIYAVLPVLASGLWAEL